MASRLKEPRNGSCLPLLNEMNRRTFSIGLASFLVVGSHLGALELPEDIADMKVQDLRAAGDDKKRYFLIERPGGSSKEGWRTLFVLPGGSGDAEFQSFVTRIAKHALPEGYLVVQLVAPVWSAHQAKTNVWPDENSPAPEAKFKTTDFFLAVRTDVAKSHKLDPRFSFTLTWSSSGMIGYLLSLLPKSSVTGTFVAMSVFQSAKLPNLSSAKGRPYFLYHSPQDFIPVSHAESARDALTKAGAIVELQTYEGGHGWRGNVFGDIRKGIDWLEAQASKTQRK
jgi:predicted esterase